MAPPSWLPAALVLCALTAAAADRPDDFTERDALPQTTIPQSEWYAAKFNGSWGPHPAALPPVAVPAGVEDPLAWRQARVVAAAKHYLGLPYQHHHIPAWTPPTSWNSKLGGPESAGLDCSNFTAWVYNFALGIRFTSEVNAQADGPQAPGRRLAPAEPLAPGDLLFIQNQARTEVTHVVIYLYPGHIIDDHASGVAIRPFRGWYTNCFSHARRILE